MITPCYTGNSNIGNVFLVLGLTLPGMWYIGIQATTSEDPFNLLIVPTLEGTPLHSHSHFFSPHPVTWNEYHKSPPWEQLLPSPLLHSNSPIKLFRLQLFL
jgi:hypothetical protein